MAACLAFISAGLLGSPAGGGSALPSDCALWPDGRGARAPRVQVVDVFHDLMHSGEFNAQGQEQTTCMPAHQPEHWTNKTCPWNSAAAVRNQTLLGMRAMQAGGRWLDWQPPVCAPMDNMALTPDPAAQQLCVHAAPIYTRRARAGEEHKVLQYAFEQYDSELHAMRRWLQVGEICDHGLSHPFGAPGTNPVPCNADVLAECMGRAAHRFLDRMVKVWRNAGSRATVVLVETLPFNLVTERQLLRALTRLPPQLVRRLVIGCSMSNLPITMQQVYREHYGGWQVYFGHHAAWQVRLESYITWQVRSSFYYSPLP
ncbi:hypothetical protein T492DRAFT_250445 [Pavlovales sp. CCMP2436]|nr:hypothetical protein T492DRAFT_250445 [Pavlovales sp. CCMP2436]